MFRSPLLALVKNAFSGDIIVKLPFGLFSKDYLEEKSSKDKASNFLSAVWTGVKIWTTNL